jgi:release factor glutamine methyltransferase
MVAGNDPGRPGSFERSLLADLGRREAAWVLEDVGVGPGRPATADQVRAVAELSRRRVAGEPLQYVLGHWPFRHLDLLVDRRALIPRPETEWVTDVALAELDRLVGDGRPARVVDLGTGTGAIALSVATERAGFGVEVTGTDVEPDALDLARSNQERLAAGHDGVGSVRWRQGSWWEALDPGERGTITLVVANPPYVSAMEWEVLDPVVRDYEPHRALVAETGSDGTPAFAAVETILTGAPEWLSRPGAAVVEISPAQGASALWAAERLGASGARVLSDLAGRPRALVARWG